MPTQLEVPPDQLNLPRRDRQFPYRPANDQEEVAVREELGEVIRGVTRLIFRMIRTVVPWAPSELRDDWFQEIAIHLVRYSLPRYDQWKEPRTKVSTFCSHCSRMKLSEIVRTYLRRHRNRERRLVPIDLASPEQLQDVDRSLDLAVERIADEVLAEPTILGYLGPAHVHDAREMSLVDTAAKHGVIVATLSSNRLRAREKVRGLLDDAA